MKQPYIEYLARREYTGGFLAAEGVLYLNANECVTLTIG